MENLPRRGFADACCACSFMSFRWEIVRDSPMVIIITSLAENGENLISAHLK